MKSITLPKQRQLLESTHSKFSSIKYRICIIFIQQQKPRNSYFLIKEGNFLGKFGLCAPELCPLDWPNFELLSRLSTNHPFVIREDTPQLR